VSRKEALTIGLDDPLEVLLDEMERELIVLSHKRIRQ
jgi:hypothetical protein